MLNIKKKTVLAYAVSLAMVAQSALMPLAYAQNDAANGAKEPTYTLGSNELDIIKLIQTVSAATGRTMVIDPSVKGKVKIMTNHNELNKDELYELFRTVLEISNYTVVEVGDVTRVIPLKEARTSPLREARNKGGNSEFVTDVIPLQNIAATKVLTVLRPLVAQHAALAAHDSSNSIVITDTLANITRIRQLIKKIDTAATPTTEVVQLRFAEAEAMVTTLTKLSAGNSKDTGLAGKLQLVADARNNAVLISGEDLQRDRMKALISRLDRPQQQTGNVRVVYLEYADATQVAETLTRVVQNMARLVPGGGGGSAGGAGGAAGQGATVEADEATNSLLITAGGDSLNSLLAVVERLDIRRAQVLIDAIIVQMTVSDGEELGVEWLFANQSAGAFGGSIDSGAIGAAATVFPDDDGETGTIRDLAQGIIQAGGNTLGVAGTTAGEEFAALLTALKASSKAEILSTPSLLTMDNNEASISVGQNVPFRTGSFTNAGTAAGTVNPFSTIEREDVGILLTVTPQVNEGNKVLLNIAQEVSNIANDSSDGLITNQSTIDTQILANDGEIVVLGGLIQEDVQDSVNQVPILGSIPILGNLFKFQSTNILKSNLMVFLRARIMREDEQMYGATAEKYRTIRDQQLQLRKEGLSLKSSKLLPVLPELGPRNVITPVEEETDSDSGVYRKTGQKGVRAK